jgi:hypothetical protein
MVTACHGDGILSEPHAGNDPGGGASLPEHEHLRPGDALPGEKVELTRQCEVLDAVAFF